MPTEWGDSRCYHWDILLIHPEFHCEFLGIYGFFIIVGSDYHVAGVFTNRFAKCTGRLGDGWGARVVFDRCLLDT